jgi:stage IV sporulation protein FB
MRDFFSWSLPLGRVFGISVRVHVLLPLVAAGLILRVVFQKNPELPPGTWIDMSMLLGLMFFSILLHEFGHCYAGRLMDGEANEVLLWPLGGLAMVDVPQTPRANFVVAIAGPAVNLLLFVVCGLLLALLNEPALAPTWNPLPSAAPFRNFDGDVMLKAWNGVEYKAANLGIIVLARLCYVNWLLFLFNMLLIGFPMDAGRMFQCILWKYVGYRQATLAAIFAGFLTALVLGLIAIIFDQWLYCALGIFIFASCWQQRVVLESGGEESLFGYDFSQGYTSLERDHPPSAAPPRRRLNWFQRWSQRRAARKLLRETEQREAEERRMDELLEKVQRHGLPALSDEERRFLKRVSDRYRNRH